MEYEVLQSFKGSPDGYTINEYEKGKIVDLPDDLATIAIRNKWVKKPEGKKTPSEEKKGEDVSSGQRDRRAEEGAEGSSRC
jgi:hypothetical protein